MSESGELVEAAMVEAAARAMHDDDIAQRYVEVAYPECAEQYRRQARVALGAALPHDPERKLLRKLVDAASVHHSENDGGTWLAWDGGVSPDLTTEELALVAVVTKPPKRLAHLLCGACHTTLWPADLLPYPTQCVINIGGTSLCNRPLRDTGARFVREAP